MMYVLDTNIISYALKSDVEIRRKLDEITAEGNEILMPHVVYFEVKRWLIEIGATSKQRVFEQMLHDAISLEPFGKAEWDVAATLWARLRKFGHPAGDADLLIAAFCIINDYTLITNNVKDFENIDELNFINWKE